MDLMFISPDSVTKNGVPIHHHVIRKGSVTNVLVCPSEHQAKQLAAHIRKEDGRNARVYARDIRVSGCRVTLWTVVSLSRTD